MGNTPLPLTGSDVTVPLPRLQKYTQEFLISGEVSQLSDQTTATRRIILRNFIWWMRREEHTECTVAEIREFLLYVRNGHLQAGGRWGNKALTKPVKPCTVKDYFRILRTFFRWCVAEQYLPASPVDRIKQPIDRQDEVQPYTPEQVEQLLGAARRSTHPLRDELICLFLLDTGVRASELINLRIKDLDLVQRRATVEGKGGKARSVYFGRSCTRLLFRMHNGKDREPDEPVFASRSLEPFTRSGLLQVIERLARDAGLADLPCNMHKFRHTFAVSFLRNGGQEFTLCRILGHTSLSMTRRYVSLAQADVQNSHRQFSPADGLTSKGKRR